VAGPAILRAEDNRPPPKTALRNEPVPDRNSLIFQFTMWCDADVRANFARVSWVKTLQCRRSRIG
jgi:hypothetical protein